MAKQKWTVEELLKAQQPLERLASAQTRAFGEDASLAFDLARIYRQVEPEVTVAHQLRLALLRECGATEQGQNLIMAELSNQEKYQEEYEARLMNVERSLNVEPIAWSRFKEANLPMRIGDLAFLVGLVFELDGEGVSE